MIYLASPYSHKDPIVRSNRYYKALFYTTVAMKRGETIFSPIVYGHHIHLMGYEDYTAAGWIDLNRCMLAVTTEMRVLTLDEWHESKGVLAEIKHAQDTGIKVNYVGPNP